MKSFRFGLIGVVAKSRRRALDTRENSPTPYRRELLSERVKTQADATIVVMLMCMFATPFASLSIGLQWDGGLAGMSRQSPKNSSCLADVCWRH